MRCIALNDFQTPLDLRPVVEDFYATIQDDPALGPFFAEVDLDAHVETLIQFWSNVVFGEAVYRGRPFQKHLNFAYPLTPAHFDVWVGRLERCVDAHAAGPNAERMKASGRQIATVFQMRLGLLDVMG
ncbi:MAG: group III truncated hemoglobin [Rhodothermales bacterium]|nr:group III truncated hemoglobin [Rhodothermales bacterium]